MSIRKWVSGYAALLALGGVAAQAQDAAVATAAMRNLDGRPVGEAKLRETPNGLIISAEFTELPEGIHGFHIHAVGQCEPPFQTAGGHFNPDDHQHGMKNPQGKHSGDLPNVLVPASGAATVEHFAVGLTLENLSGEDGTSLVVHADADDYSADPAGNAGDRIACGVVTR